MVNPSVDTHTALDGTQAVRAQFDLTSEQLAACAHGLAAARRERYRIAELSTDDVLAMRELTALGDGLEDAARHGAHVTLPFTVARLGLLRDGLESYAASRADGDLREGDAEALRHVHALLEPLGDLHAAALRAALDASAPEPAAA